jgi:hypothetical protein
MKTEANGIYVLVRIFGMIVLAFTSLGIGVHAADEPTTATQTANQNNVQPSTSRKLSGVVVQVDADKKLIKVVVWDETKGDFKRNDTGRYQAQLLKWSKDTVIEDEGEKKISEIEAGNGFSDLKSVTDLVGWKTAVTFKKDSASKISLLAAFSGESFAGMGGNNGFSFISPPSGKTPVERTQELDKESDVVIQPVQENASKPAG